MADQQPKKIAVIGGGIGGLATAYYLSSSSAVEVFERSNRLGGLAASFPIERTELEAFYHHFFKSDNHLISLINELGLAAKVGYHRSSISMIYPDGVYPFSRPKDLLTFPRLAWFSKLAFGLHTIYLRRTKEWRALENLSVEEWMERHYGRQVYEQIWRPLLKAKFGEHADRVPMSWLWGRIHPRSNSRQGGEECLGYLEGSLSVLFNALGRRIKARGGRIRLNAGVDEVSVRGDGVEVRSGEKVEKFDGAILALDTEETLKIVADLPDGLKERLERIEYFGAICLVLKLKRPLGDRYWLNSARSDLPISGIIEHTNLVPREWYGGHSVTYVFRYLSPNDPLYRMENSEVENRFRAAVKEVFPRFDPSQVAESFLFKTPKATPVYKDRYSGYKPPLELLPGRLYMINTAQIYPEDRNLNNGVALAKELVARIGLS